MSHDPLRAPVLGIFKVFVNSHPPVEFGDKQICLHNQQALFAYQQKVGGELWYETGESQE